MTHISYDSAEQYVSARKEATSVFRFLNYVGIGISLRR